MQFGKDLKIMSLIYNAPITQGTALSQLTNYNEIVEIADSNI